MQYTRETVIGRLHRTLSEGRAILAAGAGIGVTAKFAERGRADLIVIYNSGRYRMGGHSSWAGLLPIGDANQIVLEMGEREILPVIKEAPVIAGVFPSDPTRELGPYLDRVLRAGFSGVINFPTVALLEGEFRANMESTGLGFARDVELVRLASAKGMFTMAYVFDPEQARAVVEAGVDCVVAHMGNTAGGSVGQEGVPPLEDAVLRTRDIAASARGVRPEVIVLCHGGPIATPDEAAHVIREARVDGFVGASSVERLPVEQPLQAAAAAFSSITLDR